MKIISLSMISLPAMTLAGSVLAADLPRAPVYKAQPAAAAVYNWNGFYVGGHVGWGFVDAQNTIVSDSSGAFPAGFRFCCDRDGFIGGAQIGFNWQAGSWVFGVEGDWSWTNSSTQVHSNSPLIPGVVLHSSADDNWFATITGRLGYAQQAWLFYIKGGVAFHNHSDDAVKTGFPGLGTITFAPQGDGTTVGWTVGAGVEWALLNNWSAKVEYDYMDFGVHRHTFTAISPAPAVGFSSPNDIETTVHVVKIGLNYRFDFGKQPVVAKY